MAVDDELLAALLAADEDDMLRAVESLPAEALQPLLGLLGAGDAAKIPATPAEQAQELNETYLVRPHIELLSDTLADAIDDVEKRGISRQLIVSMPPRHGKTELSSVYFPVWVLRRNPKAKIGIISHSPNLAASWGRRVRREVERHGARLGIAIAPDAGAVSEWETTEGGGVMSRSIGQALAGVGFNVLIVDDPVRDFAAAHSEATRKAVWEWWTANVVTRLEPPYLVVVVATRWHEDDLIGRLLSRDHDGDPDEWDEVTIPAIADHDPAKGESDALGREPGEPLLSPLIPNEDREGALERLGKLARSVGSYAWSALFQQKPAPAKGAIFDISWWRYWTTDPARATADGKVRYIDPAELRTGRVIDSWDATFKGTDGSDYVVGQRWAAVGANRFLLWQSRARRSFTQTVAEMEAALPGGSGATPYADLVRERLVEDKANGPAIIDLLRDKISGLLPVNPRGSKEARARAVTPAIESGNVYLPDPGMPGYEWVSGLITEARSFPSGSNDDQVDSMTQALDHLYAGGSATIVSPVGRELAARAPGAPTRASVAARRVVVSRTGGARTDGAMRRGR